MFKDRALRELPYAQRSVREAKEKLAHLDELRSKGLLASLAESRLLRTLRQTYELQVRHLEVLRSEAEGDL